MGFMMINGTFLPQNAIIICEWHAQIYIHFPKSKMASKMAAILTKYCFLKITFAFNVKTGLVSYHFKGNWILFKMILLWWVLWWLMAHFYPKMPLLFFSSKNGFTFAKLLTFSCYKILLHYWFITFVKVTLIWKQKYCVEVMSSNVLIIIIMLCNIKINNSYATQYFSTFCSSTVYNIAKSRCKRPNLVSPTPIFWMLLL